MPMGLGGDALQTAMDMSYPTTGGFQSRPMSEQSDLAKEVEDAFYGGGTGSQPPAPTPTPTPPPTSGPPKPTQMNLTQLMDHFGVPNPIQPAAQPMNMQSPTQTQDWRAQYGWTGLYS